MESTIDSCDAIDTSSHALQHSQSPSQASTMKMELPSRDNYSSPIIPKLLFEASNVASHESSESPNRRVTLHLKRGRYRLLYQHQFKNSLLAGVGYLELANAGDFAANVWNEVPVPNFAAVLMAIGGTLALFMVLVAIQDCRLSWKNVKLLRMERAHLQHLGQSHNTDADLNRLIDGRLGVQVRELGTEIVDRMVMDVLMGFGSMLVGIGTLMAIGGANPQVYHASNLLSGYIGNGMAAVFGLANAIWSGYLLYRFHMYNAATCAREPCDAIRRRLRTRFRRFQWHAGINGFNGLVAGAASMVTAERWWGYVVLIPCIICLILCNYFWRQKLGYDRQLFECKSLTDMSLISAAEELRYVSIMQRSLAESEPFQPQGIVQLDCLEILRFIVRESMLETYCESLAHDKTTRHLLKELPSSTSSPEQIIVSIETLFGLPTNHLKIIFQHAKKFLQTTGIRIFTHRERYLLELLGHTIYQDHIDARARQDDTIERN